MDVNCNVTESNKYSCERETYYLQATILTWTDCFLIDFGTFFSLFMKPWIVTTLLKFTDRARSPILGHPRPSFSQTLGAIRAQRKPAPRLARSPRLSRQTVEVRPPGTSDRDRGHGAPLLLSGRQGSPIKRDGNVADHCRARSGRIGSSEFSDFVARKHTPSRRKSKLDESILKRNHLHRLLLLFSRFFAENHIFVLTSITLTTASTSSTGYHDNIVWLWPISRWNVCCVVFGYFCFVEKAWLIKKRNVTKTKHYLLSVQLLLLASWLTKLTNVNRKIFNFRI